MAYSFSLPYGSGVLTGQCEHPFDVIHPEEVLPHPDPMQCVREALRNPVGHFRLDDFRGARSAAIAINDKTRPVPHEILLPPLLAELERIGIPIEQTFLIIATGTHIPMPAEEFGLVLPAEIYGRYPVESHDCDDRERLTRLGNTRRGTPAWMNTRFLEADLRIVVGNIEPHHFMGFSGGVKSAAIGLGGRETIDRNHAMLVEPNCAAGIFDENPMRQDIEEIGQMAGIHLAVNAVLNHGQRIVRVFAGHPVDVMRTAIPVSRQICQSPAAHSYDLVIAAPGGYPKDINLYQSQKGLTHAAMLARDGGVVILAAECREGIGSNGYEHFMEGVSSVEGVFEKFSQTGFTVGPHKALQFAKIMRRVHVIVVSEIPAKKLDELIIPCEPDLERALQRASMLLPGIDSIALMPQATHTVPALPQTETGRGIMG